MIDPFDTLSAIDSNGGFVSRETAEQSRWIDGLRRLPQPLHLFEFVARSQHYHFGCFGLQEGSLGSAQDRMSLWSVRRLAAGSSVLDIGCGLGGTSRLLARMGFRVTALDPCHEAVAYARMRSRASASNSPRFFTRTLESFAHTARTAFDGALAIEILQHFPELAEFFGGCRKLLRPGGILLLHDVPVHVETDWSRVPFHPPGRVRAAAEAAGFRIVERQDLTREVLPTLPRAAAELEERRAELLAEFGGRYGRPVERELEQLLLHMRDLQRALERGQISYEALVLVLDCEVTPCA